MSANGGHVSGICPPEGEDELLLEVEKKSKSKTGTKAPALASPRTNVAFCNSGPPAQPTPRSGPDGLLSRSPLRY